MEKNGKYTRFLNDYYYMKSKITLKDYLSCLCRMDVVDIYTIDAETNEEYFGTFGLEDIKYLDKNDLKMKVIKIKSDINKKSLFG